MGLAFGQDLSERSLAECTPETVRGWDSLAFLNLIALLEEVFGVEMGIEDIAKMTESGSAIKETIEEKIIKKD